MCAGSPGAAAAVDSPAGTAIVSPVTVTGATVSFTYTVADSTVPSLSLAVFVYGVAVCVAQVHKGYAGGRTHIATHTCPASSSFCVGGKGDWLALLSPSPVNKLSLYSLPSFKDLPSSLRASATTGTTAVAICAGRESDGNLLVVSRQGRGMVRRALRLICRSTALRTDTCWEM